MAARSEGFSFAVGRRHSRERTESHRGSIAFTPDDNFPGGQAAAAPPVAPTPPPAPPAGAAARTDSPVVMPLPSSPHAPGSSVAIPPTRSISWRCGPCGYHLLAMDHNGQPLTFGVDAFGKPIPLQCPRCALEHIHWEQAVPFNAHGDFVNIKSSFSNHIARSSAAAISAAGGAGSRNSVAVTTAALGEVNTLPLLQRPTYAVGGGVDMSAAIVSAVPIPPVLQAIGTVTYKDDQVIHLTKRSTGPTVVPTAYFCGKCSRRMQRVDQFGKLVPLELDPYGQVVPLTCPGCKATHADWATKPFRIGE
jgi:hypothetical protein